MMWERKPEKAATSTPVQELIGGSPVDFPERYKVASPAEMLPLDTPQWLFHGTHDVRVPPEISVSYARRAIRAGDRVHLDLIPGADHFVHLDLDSPTWNKIRSTVLNLLDLNSTE
jgi:pimeloyl-ACP methyl ester carboxylesterase